MLNLQISSGEEKPLVFFSDVGKEVGLVNLGILGQTSSWADYDNDGDLDLILSNTDRSKKSNFFFENSGGFNDVLESIGITGESFRTTAWGDYDNDGYIDLIVGTIKSSSPPILYKNSSGKIFIDASEETNLTVNPGTSGHVLWVDFNNDGLLDIFHVSSSISVLYKNEGYNSFTDITFEAGLEEPYLSNSALWFDFNNDGFSDLYLTNRKENKLFQNNGNETFTDVTKNAGVGGNPEWNSVAACAGDFDNDGDEDLYVGNIYKRSGNILYENNGNGTFTDITEKTGTSDIGDARTCTWVDFDADGYLDLYTSNHINPTKVFRNIDGKGTFKDVATEIGLEKPLDVFSAAWGDYDNDGFLDVFLNGHIGIALKKNSGNQNSSLTLELEGDGRFTNRSAIGSRAFVTSSGIKQLRTVNGGRGNCEQDMLALYFGLGSETEVDIKVDWTSGEKCEFNDFKLDKNMKIKIYELGCEMEVL
ncbi:MAG: CRTAC1 family protein [Thermodesulfobacteriota bacterium]